MIPLGHIQPTGWLEHVLRAQADGLTGHLDEFWPDVARSGWIGGEEEGWERAPYWLDGLVPLAWLLNDTRLQEKAHRWIGAILAGQQDDGWLGSRLDRARGASRAGGARNYDFPMDPWPRFILLKVLIQYESATSDMRIVPAVGRFLRCLGTLVASHPLRSWGRMRWADAVQSIYWYVDRTGEVWPLDIVDTLASQGFDWHHHAERFPYWTRVDQSEIALHSHGPNNAMGVKAGAVLWRRTRDPQDAAASGRLLDALDAFHGQANGMFSCDEHLAGRAPHQGSELCAVAELMYSCESVAATLGQLEWFDRTEFLAFNALPATISADMWTHQYDQQVNQVQCAVAEERVYTSNGPDANLFGLEPHYGCCTANMHQAWPKFAQQIWMQAGDGALALVSLVPSRVETRIGSTRATGEVHTTYPFGSKSVVTLNASADGAIVRIRIPKWATRGAVTIDGMDVEIEPDSMVTIRIASGIETIVRIVLDPEIQIVERSPTSVSITKGPLLYALPLDAQWTEVVHRDVVSDFELHTDSEWRFAVTGHPNAHLVLQSHVGSAFGNLEVTAIDLEAFPISAWPIERGAAAPIETLDRRPTGPAQVIRLVPYGLTSLRIGEFPIADL
jgi:hypothetical protein